MNRDSIVSLAELDRASLPMAGGKAANLGELLRAGVPVPGGFVLTTQAYQAASSNETIASKLEILAGVDARERAKLSRLAAEIREAILALPIPDEMADAVVRAYTKDLEGCAVAVRSSATAEDLPDASFAGQQDTYLGVLGVKPLLDAIRRCWASLFNERAVAYRADRNIDPRHVALAVVVQRLVDVKTAGVLFTANPVTGRRHEAVIDAALGLGEAVVSGATNPDHLIVRTETGKIVEKRIGEKQLIIEAVESGGTRHIESAAATEVCISDEEARALARMGEKVEKHFGAPQDIEWAIDKQGRIFIVQSRPITTLYPIPKGPWSNKSPLRVYFSFNVGQGVFQPLTPMGIQFWKSFTGFAASRIGLWDGDPLRGAPMWAVSGDRLFMDITDVLQNDVGRKLFAFAAQRMEARTGEVIQSLMADERIGTVHTPTWKLAANVLRGFARTRAPVTLVKALANPEEVPTLIMGRAEAAIALGEVPEGAPPMAYVDAVEKMLREGITPFMLVAFPSIASGAIAMRVMRRALGEDISEDEVHTLLRSLPNNPTTEMDLELWHLSRRVKNDEASRLALQNEKPSALAKEYRRRSLPQVLQNELEAFLAKYGARGVAEIDIGVTRWGEDPAHILGSLANYLALGDEFVAPDVAFARGAEDAEKMAAELSERARKRGFVKGKVGAFAIHRVRRLLGAREVPKFGIVRILTRARGLLQEAGRILVKEGKIEHVDDVFLLDLHELRELIAGKNLTKTIAERRDYRKQEMGRKHVPRVILSDGTEPEVSLSRNAGGHGLSGTPASSGVVSGKARVILDPIGAKIEPGEILVAPSTDPGWTPLFLTAAGLVMEMGGSMSHGSVVAREYGIPAVVGVPEATRRITTGQVITVNGGAGTVSLE
jgi:pyruvate,water dikinase